jgi:probable HAF family extracellular repeat protein
MKMCSCISILVTTLLALAIPASVLAQEPHQSPGGETSHAVTTKEHHHYKLIVLGTLGGPQSYGVPGQGAANINNQGTAVGVADTAIPDPFYPNFNSLFASQIGLDPFVYHAFTTKGGALVDLGGLPGGTDSNASFITENGLVSGNALNGSIDPLTSVPAENAVLWKDGKIINLGTLGGYESGAGQVNSRGQVVGFSSNTTPDPLSLFGLVTQTRAFFWQDGKMEDLGTLGGPDAVAVFINEQGQAAGLSYTNSTPNPGTGIPTTDPFLWDKGKMIDLGTLGGTLGGLGETVALNNRGQVVGTSNTAGDIVFHPFLWTAPGPMRDLGTLGGPTGTATAINDAGDVIGFADYSPNPSVGHAFVWRHGKMTDLGTLEGDCQSGALGINNRGQIVGGSISCDGTITRAVLWEDGQIIDLSVFVPPGTDLTLTGLEKINERGELFGGGVRSDGQLRAFLLIPCDENHPDIEGCDYSLVDARAATAAQAVSGTRDSKLTAAGQVRGPLSSTGALAAARESTPVRQLLLQRLGFARFTGSVFSVTSDPVMTSGPSATLSPASLTFSTQAVGTTSSAETVSLKNTGATSLAISSITITGTDHADFTQTHTCGTSLAAGASCSISVEFSPMASGSRTAILSVADNSAGSPQKVTLAGTGTTAKLSPTSLYFGGVGIGATTPAQIVTLTNVGTTTLTISGIAITGAEAADFAQTHTCGSSLAAYASCIIRVSFKPTALSTRAATLIVTDSAAGSPQKVSLAGVGTTARLSPTSLYFAPVTVGMTSPAQIVTLTNVGTTTLRITAVAITGSNAADFVQTHTCASSLAAGASCSISVTFKPTTPGLRNAALSVSDNAGGSPQTVSICGGCLPFGHPCYGPGPNLNRCCPAPFPHHSFCSNSTGWGTCVES